MSNVLPFSHLMNIFSHKAYVSSSNNKMLKHSFIDHFKHSVKNIFKILQPYARTI
jgi:hypothetical protein